MTEVTRSQRYRETKLAEGHWWRQGGWSERGENKRWGGKRESNPQPPEPQSGALPVELFPPQLFDYSNGSSVGDSDPVRRALTRRRAGIPVRSLLAGYEPKA
jgi:hypothetical protein